MLSVHPNRNSILLQYSTRTYQGSIVETNDDSEQLLSVLSGEALYFALVI